MALVGCAGPRVELPAAHYPRPQGPADARSAGVLVYTPPPAPDPKAGPLTLPHALPGSAAPPLATPKFDKDVPQAEREAAVQKAFPALTPVAHAEPPAGEPLTLADLRQMAAAHSPVLRRAAAEADASCGQVIQAGLYPNPTVGYQTDQVQPGLKIPEGSSRQAGQQGGFVNQLIKTSRELKLALGGEFSYVGNRGRARALKPAWPRRTPSTSRCWWRGRRSR